MAAKTVKAGVVITGKDATASAFASLSKSLSKSEQKFKAFKGSMSGLAGGLGIISGVAVGAFAALGGAIGGAVYGMKKMLDSTEEMASGLADFSKQTGFGVEQLQELDYAAKQNGISLEKNRAMMSKFAKSFTNIKTGVGGAGKELQKVDNVLYKQLKTASSASDAYEIMLNRLATLEDPIKRNAVALALFGKSGGDMLRMVADGPEALKNLRAEMQKLGVLTAAEVANADAYGDSVDRLNTAFGGLKSKLAVSLMPALTDASTMLADFVAEHRSDIVQAFSGVVASTGDMVKNLVKYLADNPDAFKNFIGDAADVMKKFVDSVKDVQNFITDIKGFLGLGPDRQAVALGKADTTIEGAVPKGVGGGIFGGAKAAINDIVNKGPLETLMSGPQYLLTQAVVAGVKAGIGGMGKAGEVTVRFKNLPPNAVVETDRSGPLVTEEFNYFDANTW